MTEHAFQRKLGELKQYVSTLQQFSHEESGHVRDLLPGFLAGLQRSLEDLNTAAGLLENESAGSNGTSSSHGSRSKTARDGRELRFRTMAERGPVLVRIMSSETRCRWANNAWLEFTGRSTEDLLGEGWLQAVHPEDRDRCAKICYEAIDRTRLHGVEYRLQRKNGEYGWVLEIGTPRLNARGSVCGYLGTAIEITEHKRAETHLALQYAVVRVLSATETAEDAIAPILQMLCESLGWDVGELWSVDAGRVPHCAQVWASPLVDASGLQEGSRTRAFPECACPPWQGGSPFWIADITLDESLGREPEARLVGLHTMFRLPIAVHGEVRAILRFFCRGVRQEDHAVVEFMTAIGVQISQVIERQRIAEKVRESEARKAAILEASLDAVITIDHQGRVVEFNSAAEKLFGYRRDLAVGHELAPLVVPPRMREQALAAFASYLTTGANGLLGKRLDAIAMKADGSEFPVEVALAPITPTGNNQPMLTIFVSDVTGRRNSEQQVRVYQERLRALMADLLLTEEQERRRLAVDLHDGLSQTIALTQIKLSALRLSVDDKLKQSFDEIEELILQTNRAARSISFELSPPVLHDLGLEPAVQWLVENIQSRYGIEIALEDDGQPKPADEKVRVILFRSIRELLINAAKHAGARRVRLRLEREGDGLSAAIEDDGVGMEPDKAPIQGSGLFSIQERLNHVGGSMSIDSAPGKGTKIRLRAPLANRRSKEKVEA